MGIVIVRNKDGLFPNFAQTVFVNETVCVKLYFCCVDKYSLLYTITENVMHCRNILYLYVFNIYTKVEQ